MADPPPAPQAAAPARARYHHGDLRGALLRAAREEVARSGAQAVSLTSLARLAGVSQPAPYRHFADREALLRDVALMGFEELLAALDEALSGSAAAQAPRAAAWAYAAFGEANIEVYRLMFASRLVPKAPPGSALGAAADAAFDRLQRVLGAATPGARPDEAYLAWAQLHGLVMLKADGFIDRPLQDYVDRAGWPDVRPGADP